MLAELSARERPRRRASKPEPAMPVPGHDLVEAALGRHDAPGEDRYAVGMPVAVAELWLIAHYP